MKKEINFVFVIIENYYEKQKIKNKDGLSLFCFLIIYFFVIKNDDSAFNNQTLGHFHSFFFIVHLSFHIFEFNI